MTMLNKIMIATNNANKLREAREIFSPLGIEVVSPREAGVSADPEETGTTFRENAYIKARTFHALVDMPVFADDSGICVDALDGRPGVYSARYAPDGNECEKLLGDMKDVPEGKRTAHYACVIAFVDGDTEADFSGICEGSIGYEKRGTNGFGYDPIFLRGDRTMAEMTPEEKNSISHRSAAMKGLYEFIKERYGE